MVAVIIVLSLLLLLGWAILYHHFKALRIANINLVKQAQKEASLQYQLREAREKYCKLEEKLRKVQYELHNEKRTENHL
ncbi:hypothetical protein SAMN05660461_0368 [Chitinophaga ginsengisegetis]|uniref:Uncharacterized protein n=1 Tax=Chitinophaga ginsengisegetis TaxID=393003 RepID=A0A1T5N569_9BACT|nr:hypothetical protein [Chitinophaga ginsengisegetis]SKC95393.1 hypothetical protein SAMN05660461_0368 [Chitinophaga ginsengisegetis]